MTQTTFPLCKCLSFVLASFISLWQAATVKEFPSMDYDDIDIVAGAYEAILEKKFITKKRIDILNQGKELSNNEVWQALKMALIKRKDIYVLCNTFFSGIWQKDNPIIQKTLNQPIQDQAITYIVILYPLTKAQSIALIIKKEQAAKESTLVVIDSIQDDISSNPGVKQLAEQLKIKNIKTEASNYLYQYDSNLKWTGGIYTFFNTLSFVQEKVKYEKSDLDLVKNLDKVLHYTFLYRQQQKQNDKVITVSKQDLALSLSFYLLLSKQSYDDSSARKALRIIATRLQVKTKSIYLKGLASELKEEVECKEEEEVELEASNNQRKLVKIFKKRRPKDKIGEITLLAFQSSDDLHSFLTFYTNTLLHDNQANEAYQVLITEDDIWRQIGCICCTLNQYSESLHYFEKAIEIYELKKSEFYLSYLYTLIGLIQLSCSLGDYKQANQWYMKAYYYRQEDVKKLDMKSIVTDLMYYKGNIDYGMKKYSEAYGLYQTALEQRKQVLGEKHISTAFLLNNLGSLYQTQKKYEQAYQYYEDCWKLFKQSCKEDCPLFVLNILKNLASVCDSMHQRKDSLAYYEEILNIISNHLIEYHPLAADIYHLMGIILHEQANYSDALKAHHRALKIRTRVLGKESFSTTLSTNEIASIYLEQEIAYDKKSKQYMNLQEKSLIIYDEILKIRQQTTTKNSIWTARTLHNKAVALYYNGHANEALECTKACSKIKTKKNMHFAHTLYNLTFLYQLVGNNKQFLGTLHDALKKAEQVLDDKNGVLVYIHHCLGDYYLNTEQYKLSFHHFTKALKINKKTIPSFHPETACSLYYLAKLYLEKSLNDTKEKKLCEKQAEQAHKLLQEAWVIQKKKLGPYHWSTSKTVYQLGRVACTRQEYRKAIEYYMLALGPEVIKNIQLKKRPLFIAKIWFDLGIAYERLDQDDEAQEFYQKSLTIRLDKLGEQDPNTIDTMNKLRLVHQRLGHESAYISLSQRIYLWKTNKLGKRNKAVKNLKKEIELAENKIPSRKEPSLSLSISQSE
ncbi:MAG: tetratricopeptide repeat protein [Bacteroidota bacterium]